MCGRLEDLRRRGARLVFVGPGTAAMAAGFAATSACGQTVLTDPTLRVQRAAGMRRGLGSMLRWQLLKNAWRALRGGFRQSKVLGDPWQQGGALVFDRDGALLHSQADRAVGDPLDLDALLAALPPPANAG